MDQVPKFSGTQCLGIRDARLASCFYCLVPAVPLASTRGQPSYPLQSSPFSTWWASSSAQPGPWALKSHLDTLSSQCSDQGRLSFLPREMQQKLRKGKSCAQGHTNDPWYSQKSPSSTPYAVLSSLPSSITSSAALRFPLPTD